jgi:hypothetical protein
MFRSMLRNLSRSLTSTSSRPARPLSGRTLLGIEDLENRLAPSTAYMGYLGTISTPVVAQGDVVTGAGPGAGPVVIVVDATKLSL